MTRDTTPTEPEASACPPAARCPDRTFCPGSCRLAGNREGNHRLPLNPTPQELEKVRRG